MKSKFFKTELFQFHRVIRVRNKLTGGSVDEEVWFTSKAAGAVSAPT